MTQQNRIVLTVVAALAAAAAYYFMILAPKREEATALTAQITAAQGDLQTARQLLATNQSAKGSYRKAYTSVVRLGKAVPADDDVRSLMVQLDAAAESTKIDFRTIAVGTAPGSGVAAAGRGTPAGIAATQLPPGATVGPAGFPVMPFSFTFKGKFFRLSDFLARLERFVTVRNERVKVTGRLLTLDGIDLKIDEAGFPNIKAQISATSYLVSPTQGLTAGATSQGPAKATPPVAADSSTAPVTTATTTGVIR